MRKYTRMHAEKCIKDVKRNAKESSILYFFYLTAKFCKGAFPRIVLIYKTWNKLYGNSKRKTNIFQLKCNLKYNLNSHETVLKLVRPNIKEYYSFRTSQLLTMAGDISIRWRIHLSAEYDRTADRRLSERWMQLQDIDIPLCQRGVTAALMPSIDLDKQIITQI